MTDDHQSPAAKTPAQESAGKASVLADGINHAINIIGANIAATKQERLIALAWVLAGELAGIPDHKIRKEARAIIDRQVSINLARMLSGLEG